MTSEEQKSLRAGKLHILKRVLRQVSQHCSANPPNVRILKKLLNDAKVSFSDFKDADGKFITSALPDEVAAAEEEYDDCYG